MFSNIIKDISSRCVNIFETSLAYDIFYLFPFLLSFQLSNLYLKFSGCLVLEFGSGVISQFRIVTSYLFVFFFISFEYSK